MVTSGIRMIRTGHPMFHGEGMETMSKKRTQINTPKATIRGPRSGLKALKARGMAAVDGRSVAAKSVKAWRSSLIRDLGGVEAVSAQKQALVDAACRTQLLLTYVDAFLLSLPSIVNRRTRSCFPIVQQRMALEGSLTRSLAALGLERQGASIPGNEPRPYSITFKGGRAVAAEQTEIEGPDAVA